MEHTARTLERPGMKKVLISLMMANLVLNTGCAMLDQNVANYRDTALSNANPAPGKLAPPDYKENGTNPVMDETYLNAQADYHFTMGETLSFEGQSPRAIE